MTATIADIMTTNPVCVDAADSITAAAERMRDCDCGDVLVTEQGRLVGIVTDRDLVVRALASGADPSTEVRTAISPNVQGVPLDATLDDAVSLMRKNSIRRLPVVDDGTLVGIISIGDLAKAVDDHSALADISKAPANS